MLKKVTLFGLLAILLLGVAVISNAKQTITVLLPIGGGYTIEAQQAIADEFEAANPDIKANMEFAGWANLWNRIVTSIGAGAAPDVMYIGSRSIPALADMAAIIPLDDYITADKRAMYPESIWKTVTYNGHTYGVVRAMSTKVFVYNKKLFADKAIQIPTNWDELLAAAKKIYDPDHGVYGIAMAGKHFVSTVTQFQQYLYANEGKIVDSEGNVVINDPKAVHALNFYKELSQYAQPGIAEWTREDLIRLFETGKVGMYIDHVHNALRAMQKGIDVGFFLIPGGPDSDQPYGTCMVTDCISITAQSKNADAAWKFLNYMTSPKKQIEWDLNLGFVPPMIKEKENPEFQKPYWKPYIEAIPYGYPEAVGIKDWEGTQEPILDAIQSVLLGQSNAQTALDNAAKIIKILQK